MVTKTFGTQLKQFRLQSHDPQTGRYLTQEKLGALIGEKLGNGYSAQAVSDWERDQSQIHKDHRRVLIILIRILHEHGGIATPEEADRLLAVGNYRSLNPQEWAKVFNNLPGTKRSPTHPIHQIMPDKFAAWKASMKTLTFQDMIRCVVAVMVMLLTWFGISPMMTLAFQDRAGVLRAAFLFALTGITSPLMLSLIGREYNNDPPETGKPINSLLLRCSGCVLIFNFSSFGVFSLILACFHLNLFPLPKLLTFLISAGLILMTFSYARHHPQVQPVLHPMRIKGIVGKTLLCVALPLFISLQFFLFHDFLLSNLLGPFLIFLEMLALSATFYNQYRRLHI